MVQLLLLSDQVGRMDYISVNIEKGKEFHIALGVI